MLMADEKTKAEVQPDTLTELVDAELVKRGKQRAALDLKLDGKSFREIGRIFDITDHTAKKWVDKARQEQRLVIGQGIVTERLVPKALAVYDKRLSAGDLEAARDILFGAGVLSKQQKVTLQAVDPLAQFRAKYFGDGEVVEAEPPRQIAERTTDHDSEDR